MSFHVHSLERDGDDVVEAALSGACNWKPLFQSATTLAALRFLVNRRRGLPFGPGRSHLRVGRLKKTAKPWIKSGARRQAQVAREGAQESLGDLAAHLASAVAPQIGEIQRRRSQLASGGA